MNSTFRRFALATAALVALSGELWGQNKNTNRTPAEATFREDSNVVPPSDRIRGDGLGPYYSDDGPYDPLPDCVTAWVDKGGFFFLRTLKPYCTTTTPRSIELDFSVAVSRSVDCSVSTQYGTLDICKPNTLPDVRVIAADLFKDTALVSGTTVTLPFNLNPSPCFCASDSPGFELDFEQAGLVSGTSSVRVLTATATRDQPLADVAELYQYVKGARKQSLGRYRMPFQLTVVKH